MIDAQDERLLDELKRHTESIRDTEQHRLFTEDALRMAQEWTTTRKLAALALESLKRPTSEKTVVPD
jgi:hypothetical protein